MPKTLNHKLYSLTGNCCNQKALLNQGMNAKFLQFQKLFLV